MIYISHHALSLKHHVVPNSLRQLSFSHLLGQPVVGEVSTMLTRVASRVRYIALYCRGVRMAYTLYRSNSNGIYRRKSYDVSLPCGISFIDTLLSLFTRARPDFISDIYELVPWSSHAVPRIVVLTATPHDCTLYIYIVIGQQ